MKLIIVHYHLRPGGIRRIIELATPHLVRLLKTPVGSVVLACGEADDRKWNKLFEAHAGGTPVEFFIEPAFKYLSEQKAAPARITRRIRAGLDRLLDDATARNCLIWAHNLGIARNLILSRELARACARRRLPLIAHHHDWWFDNRWLRWPEMRRFGFRTLDAAARTIFPASRDVHHVAINQTDARILQRHFPKRAGWLPNLTERNTGPSKNSERKAGNWLHRKLDSGRVPVWLLPCRLLRRKNVGEALLLTRWLRPEAWLVTTGGISSADEESYAKKLGEAARCHHWRVRLGILQGDETGKPSVEELLAVSETVILTSIQEGFGLPYLEAVAAQRPLIARQIPNISPDLDTFGFAFPQSYTEILIDPRLFDWKAELRRQKELFRNWREHLPHTCRRFVGKPALLAAGPDPQPVPFSRLTLSAQIEVLAHPARQSWEWCAAWNPFLREWKARATAGRLQITSWPRGAAQWLSGQAYGQRFAAIAATRTGRRQKPVCGPAAQNEFIRAKLDGEHLFPLLWARQT